MNYLYTIKNEEKGKREGVEIYNCSLKVEDYIREMLEEIGYVVEKKSRGYIRLNHVDIGEIVVHTIDPVRDKVNIYLPGLRQIKINVFSGKDKGYVSYIYELERKEKERRGITIREFTDRVLEEIREFWIRSKKK